jgi:hypothetical protein
MRKEEVGTEVWLIFSAYAFYSLSGRRRRAATPK